MARRVEVEALRYLFAVVAGVAATVVVGFLLLFVGIGMVGGSECDKSECNALGAFFAAHRTATHRTDRRFRGMLVARRMLR